MITITFEANSVAELRSLITEYLGAPVTTSKPVKEKTTKAPALVAEPKEEPGEDNPPTITLEDIRALVLTGEIAKDRVKGLLGNFGCQRITEVSESDYGVFYEQLTALK